MKTSLLSCMYFSNKIPEVITLSYETHRQRKSGKALLLITMLLIYEWVFTVNDIVMLPSTCTVLITLSNIVSSVLTCIIEKQEQCINMSLIAVTTIIMGGYRLCFIVFIVCEIGYIGKLHELVLFTKISCLLFSGYKDSMNCKPNTVTVLKALKQTSVDLRSCITKSYTRTCVSNTKIQVYWN